MADSDSPKPATPRIQLQLDDTVAQGAYSNIVLVNHTENEFVFDFAYLQPANPLAKVRSRIISSPRHTKRLLVALQKNLSATKSATADGLSGEEEPIVH